jgi:mannose/cellobiose epimerase-like protein (N-acyl-D-glucosamine 2-epimerase family)
LGSLTGYFLDNENGGFYKSTDSKGKPLNRRKNAYDHMFVLLAASTAMDLGMKGADKLFNHVDSIIDQHFWDPQFKMMSNEWSEDFSEQDTYRGINANMHAVEGLLAAFDVTGKKIFRDRAFEISKRAINQFARDYEWMLPEHFDSQWNVIQEFNSENKADPFRPYGVTIGHLFEWSRLILQVEKVMPETETDRSWMLDSAKSLYEIARKFGWAADGSPGFVYTIDWQKKPVVKSRMQWVAGEAVMTAFALWDVTGEKDYLDDYYNWWRYIQENVIDKQFGSWHHELDAAQKVTSTTWSGKPDVYHAFSACVFPILPLGASLIGSAKKL